VEASVTRLGRWRRPDATGPRRFAAPRQRSDRLASPARPLRQADTLDESSTAQLESSTAALERDRARGARPTTGALHSRKPGTRTSASSTAQGMQRRENGSRALVAEVALPFVLETRVGESARAPLLRPLASERRTRAWRPRSWRKRERHCRELQPRAAAETRRRQRQPWGPNNGATAVGGVDTRLPLGTPAVGNAPRRKLSLEGTLVGVRDRNAGPPDRERPEEYCGE
jgi:hypothetical protein